MNRTIALAIIAACLSGCHRDAAPKASAVDQQADAMKVASTPFSIGNSVQNQMGAAKRGPMDMPVPVKTEAPIGNQAAPAAK